MTYYPAQQPKTTAPAKCPGCSRWFVPPPGMEMVSCTVLHAPGTCCHYSETEVPAPVGTRYEDGEGPE